MRICAASVSAEVTHTDSSARPIRMRLGAVRYDMSRAEAVELANDLIDAIEKRPR